MAKDQVRICQNCHGNTKVYKEIRPGKWEWITCPACNGKGYVVVPNI